jgi:DNA-binding response OmpR family regulator
MPGNLGMRKARCSVRRNGNEIILSPTTFRILFIIRNAHHGVTAAHIFNYIYSGRANGGPLTGPKNITVMISQMNRKLAQIGVCIKAHKRGSGAAYQVQLL